MSRETGQERETPFGEPPCNRAHPAADSADADDAAPAAELNLSQDALAGRLFMMERLGFVERSGGCGESPRTETSCCCSGCSCSGRGTTRYTLTEKGRRLAGVKAGDP